MVQDTQDLWWYKSLNGQIYFTRLDNGVLVKKLSPAWAGWQLSPVRAGWQLSPVRAGWQLYHVCAGCIVVILIILTFFDSLPCALCMGLWQLTMCIVFDSLPCAWSLTAYHVHGLWPLIMCMVFDSLPSARSLTAYHVHGGRLCVSSFLCITVSGFLVSWASLCLGF